MPGGPGEVNANAGAVGVQTVGGGLDLNAMSLEDLMFFVLSARCESLETSVRGYGEQIENRNKLLKSTNEVLAEVRYKSDNLKAGEKATMPAEMVQFFKDNGISLPNDKKPGAGKSYTLDEQISQAEKLKTWIEDNKGKADDGCIDIDLPAEQILQSRAIGIEPADDGQGAGQNWEKDDFNSLQSQVETKLIELKTQKTDRDAKIVTAKNDVEIAKANMISNPQDPLAPQKFNEAVAALAKLEGKEAPTNVATSQTYTKEQWNSIINSVQGFQEGLNNDSQLDMIKFQSLMSKYTAGVEMLSNIMKKLSENMSALVRNFL